MSSGSVTLSRERWRRVPIEPSLVTTRLGRSLDFSEGGTSVFGWSCHARGVGDKYESWASSPTSRAVMKGNRRRDTLPEMAVRRRAHAAGLRYRVDARPLSDLNRRADMVFSRAKVAVFVDGCFWHGCPSHGTKARSNAQYWAAKIAGNQARDAETDWLLREAGWTVIRVWEHEDPANVVRRIVDAVRT